MHKVHDKMDVDVHRYRVFSIHVYTLFLLFSRVLEHVQRNFLPCYVNESAETVFTPAQPYPFTDFSDSDAQYDADVGFLTSF